MATIWTSSTRTASTFRAPPPSSRAERPAGLRDLPLPSLRYWVLGVPDPAGPAQESLDPVQQHLAGLTQDGWRIAYGEYVAAAGETLPAATDTRARCGTRATPGGEGLAAVRRCFPCLAPIRGGDSTGLPPRNSISSLHVTGRRADGYHELQTLFQLIDLCDDLVLSVRALEWSHRARGRTWRR